MKPPARRQYLEAMWVLEAEGWAKRTIGEPGGPRCVIGAMGRARGLALKSYWGFGGTLLEEPIDNLWDFNDSPRTSYEDVLTLLAFGAAGALEP